MPPLLAALLMIEFDCDLRIVEAIDLGVEWRRYGDVVMYSRGWFGAVMYSRGWFGGWLGGSSTTDVDRGTCTWPWPGRGLRYSNKD
jgi:hypothetical protein